MSGASKHDGSCHCGKVKFSVEADLTGVLTTCNCSICQRTGAVLAFVPAAAFTLHQGEDALTDYQFGKKRIHHYFCSTCGTRPFSGGSMPDGTPMRAINVRCIEGVEVSSLRTQEFNGRAS